MVNGHFLSGVVVGPVYGVVDEVECGVVVEMLYVSEKSITFNQISFE